MEDEESEEPPAPGTEEDAPLKPLLRPAVTSSQVRAGSDCCPGRAPDRVCCVKQEARHYLAGRVSQWLCFVSSCGKPLSPHG